MNIDFTSLVTGAGFTVVVGWLASFIALRKDERSIQITQITEERTKWRSSIRDLTQSIVSSFSETQAPSNESKSRNRAALVTSLNPKCKHDKQILIEYDKLEHNGDLKRFTHAIALLLKHDWERVKWEATPIYLKPLYYCFISKSRKWKKDEYRRFD